MFLSISNRIHQLHLVESPRSRDCKRDCFHRVSCLHSSKNSGIRSAVSNKGNHPSSATSERHNSTDTKDGEPSAGWSQNPAGRTEVVLLCDISRKQLNRYAQDHYHFIASPKYYLQHIRTITRYVIKRLLKSAESVGNNAQDTDDRHEFFRASNPSS